MARSDLADIAQPVDFIGINYYTRNVVRHDETSWPLTASMVHAEGQTYTETGWEVHAPALTDLLLWFKQRYGDTPLYITENGAAFYDPPAAAEDGVHDPLRVSYLKAISPRSAMRSRRASTCAATCYGRCSTISNGRSAIPSGSGSSTSTSKRKCAPPRTAPNSTAGSSPATAKAYSASMMVAFAMPPPSHIVCRP